MQKNNKCYHDWLAITHRIRKCCHCGLVVASKHPQKTILNGATEESEKKIGNHTPRIKRALKTQINRFLKNKGEECIISENLKN